MEIKTILITQARKGSTRLPGKILKKVQGKQLLRIHLERLKKCKAVDKIIVATTTEAKDEEIANMVNNWGFDSFRGSENNVLDRYYQAVLDSNYKPNWIVRITSDNPLIDPELVDQIIEFAQLNNVDYVSNVFENQYPDGQDVEVFKFSALEKAWKEAKLNSDREHVTPYIRNNSDVLGGNLFSAKNFPCEKDFSNIRMTVDEELDFKVIEKLVSNLGTEKSWREYTQYIIDNKLSEINAKIIRNEGYQKSLKNDLK